MARTREFDEEAVVRAARDVFWERGYASTSLAQLQAATGLSRSSLYETYGSKRGLFARATGSYLAEVISPLLAPMEAEGAGREELARYFLTLARSLHSPDPRMARRGCLLCNTATELNDLDDDAAELVRAYRLRIRAAILHTLESIPANALRDPASTADQLTMTAIGLLITARIDPAGAATIAESLVAQVRSW